MNGTIYLDVNDDLLHSNNNNNCIHCDVCMWNFSSESDYQLHLEHLRPISGVTQKNETCVLKCEHCGRQFKQHRSLKQHFNICSAAAAKVKPAACDRGTKHKLGNEIKMYN